MNPLRDFYYLADNPFDPEVDPRRHLDLRANNLSLTTALDVFSQEDLVPYFIRVGVFAEAVERLEAYLDVEEYRGQGLAPVILIYGPGGSGISSLTHWVSRTLKNASPDGEVARKTLTVIGDHFGKVLFRARRYLERHLAGRPGLQETLDVYPDRDLKPEDPDEAQLEGYFRELRQNVADPPPMILVVDSLAYSHLDWIQRLHRSLSPLNVALILLTDSRNVHAVFADLVARRDVRGLPIQLQQLELADAETFVARRLSDFRSDDAPADRTGLFPFSPDMVARQFPRSESRTVKIIVSTLKEALVAKAEELRQRAGNGNGGGGELSPEDLLIKGQDVFAGYRDVLRHVARGASR